MATQNPLNKLHQFIIAHYDREELRTLCFNLGVDYDSLPGEGKMAQARELILYLGRQGQLEQLLKTMSQERPHFFDFDLAPAAIKALYEQLPTFGTDVTLADQRYVTQDKESLYLPPKAYPRFIGRYDQMEIIMNALRAPKRKPMIAVIGLGGIGKTTLAYEAAECSQDEGLFEHIVWSSAKPEYFVGEVAIKTGVSDYNFDTLLDDIGRQCDRVDIPRMPPDQKQMAVKYLLAKKRVLIVMDNLETVPESDKLVHDVFQILGQGKLLITSRHYVKHDQVFSINLGGFPKDEGVTFLREEGKERNVESIIQASRTNLVDIHQVTGGAPLAMKLVVGQIARQPLEVVLDTLKAASFKGPDDEFYRFVYLHSWEMLDMSGRMALVDMSVFPPLTGGAVDDVQAISQVEPDAFWPAMDQLVIMSLVDKIVVASQDRFALHPLTQYFIKSDITKEWGD